MLNFNELVRTLLFEAPALPFPRDLPQWFQDILAKHEQLGLGKLTKSDIERIMIYVNKSYIAEKDIKNVPSKSIYILDILRTIYQVVRQKPASTYREFFNSSKLETKQEIDSAGNNMKLEIDQYKNKKDWKINNTDLRSAQEKSSDKTRVAYGVQALGTFAQAAIGPGGSGPMGIYQGPG